MGDGKKQAQINSRVQDIRVELRKLLKEFPDGLSLAQLPMHLKRTLKFELSVIDLGFPKFKDLLLSMPDVVSIELKGVNHPFAFLSRAKPKKIVTYDHEPEEEEKIPSGKLSDSSSIESPQKESPWTQKEKDSPPIVGQNQGPFDLQRSLLNNHSQPFVPQQPSQPFV